MRSCKTLAAFGLTFVLLTLALAGCEQMTSGDFKGPVTGSRTSDLVNLAPAPSVKIAGNAVVLTWNVMPVGATYQDVYRITNGNSEAVLIATIWNEVTDEEIPPGQIEYVDYFTDSAKTYEYYIDGAYYTGSHWVNAQSRKTPVINGQANDALAFEGISGFSYDTETGLLRFSPSLQVLANHNAGVGTTILVVTDVVSSLNHWFDGRVALPAVNLKDLLGDDNDYAGKKVEISYDAGYKLIKNGILTLTYINHNYGLGPDGSFGSKIEVLVPHIGMGGSNLAGTLAVPANFKAEAHNNGSIELTWDAVPSVTGYEIYYAEEEGGDYDYWNYISVVPGTRTTYIDNDVELGENWYYKIKAFQYTNNGIAYSDLSAAVNARSAVTGGGTALQNSQWVNGNIGSSPQYYTFNAASGTVYYIQWDDSYDGTGAYNGDIKVSASYTGDDEIFTGVDSGYASPRYFAASKTGAITVKVEGFSSTSTGSYAIRCYTGNTAPVTYTVTFNADGGSPEPSSRTVASGDTLGSLPTAPARSGYSFGGWFTQQNGGGTQYTASSPAITENITLYAKWTANAALAAPTGVKATAQSNGSIKIEWNPVAGATGYNIYFAETPYGDYYEYDPGSSEEPVYIDWDVEPGVTWYYKVLAYNDSVESPFSDFVYATAQ